MSLTAMRHGYTLVEVLLVTSLLVIVGALAAPSMTGANERAQVRSAAEKLRSAWAQARLDAIAGGEALYFQAQLGAGTYEIAALGGAQSQAKELADVSFQQVGVTDLATNTTTLATAERGEVCPVVLFFPDGATSDAEATLATSDGYQVRVTLRGLTGAAEVSDVLRQE